MCSYRKVVLNYSDLLWIDINMPLTLPVPPSSTADSGYAASVGVGIRTSHNGTGTTASDRRRRSLPPGEYTAHGNGNDCISSTGLDLVESSGWVAGMIKQTKIGVTVLSIYAHELVRLCLGHQPHQVSSIRRIFRAAPSSTNTPRYSPIASSAGTADVATSPRIPVREFLLMQSALLSRSKFPDSPAKAQLYSVQRRLLRALRHLTALQRITHYHRELHYPPSRSATFAGCTECTSDARQTAKIPHAIPHTRARDLPD
ncbi:hypothetical protein GQ600_3385 [Phytophthora cactorum]|nr:hypothetical protein GQ600_3385 [Phytophthora cactorum]